MPLKHNINEAQVEATLLRDDGVFPNSRLPLLVYRNAMNLPEQDPASAFERTFSANQWRGSWRNGIYTCHHYHSTAHEVLGIYCGSARLQLGGDRGVIHEVRAGDVILIPAGVAHKNLGMRGEFGVVGAYPAGQEWDMNYGKPGERPQADRNIAAVPLPGLDPVYGGGGPLRARWRPH
jgi:uncharacterized protein YjlB